MNLKQETIQIPIIYLVDDDGEKVYDFEQMSELFEDELGKLDESVIIMCSVEEARPEWYQTQKRRMKNEIL